MTYTREELFEGVRTLLDRNVADDGLSVLSDDDTLSVDGLVAKTFLPAVRHILDRAPMLLIDTLRSLAGDGRASLIEQETGADGMTRYLYSAPLDCLRIARVRMGSWKRDGLIVDEGSDTARQQVDSFPGVRGTPWKPVVVVRRQGEWTDDLTAFSTFGITFECFSSDTTSDVLQSGSYVAMPAFDDEGVIDLPEHLLDAIEHYAASMVAGTLNDFDAMKRLRSEAGALMRREE